MEFGIGMFGDLSYDKQSGKFKPAEQRFAEMVEEIRLADQLGLDVWPWENITGPTMPLLRQR